MSEDATTQMAENLPWEDRVVIAETKTAEALAECSALRAELEIRETRLAALEAIIDTQKEAEAARVAAEAAAYVAELQAVATDLQQPIAADDIAKVSALMDSGNAEAARDLGDAYLLLAKTKANAAGVDVGAKPLGSTPPADHKTESASLTANILQQMGIKAEAKDGVVTTIPKRINI